MIERKIFTILTAPVFATVLLFWFSCAVGADGEEAETSEGTRYALLVGVSDYENFSGLKYADSDVALMREQLLKMGFEKENVDELTTSQGWRQIPSKEKIEAKLQELVDKVKPEDMVFVMFTGHGFAVDGVDYFAPRDAESDPNKIIKIESAVSLTGWLDEIEKSPARFKWAIIDACREDLTDAQTKGIKSGSIEAPIFNPLSSEGVFVFQSSSEKEFSYEDRDNDRGLFIGTFIDVLNSGKADLNNDFSITALEAFQRARKEVERMTENSEEYRSGKQTPFASIKGTELDFDIVKNINPWVINNPGQRGVLEVNGVEFPFRSCPRGSFTMGSPDDEAKEFKKEYSDSVDGYWETLHPVNLDAFWLLETEVTQAMWKAVMGEDVNPSKHKGDNRPVDRVSWDDCNNFVFKQNGQSLAPEGYIFALPTEAQWEYARRAGASTPFPWGKL